jgi:DNA repair exonuclease SbcCD ATPase subunit
LRIESGELVRKAELLGYNGLGVELKMYIRRLDIKGFGKLSNFTLELTGGLNIIYGRNEAGKSTLQAFIRAMLFGLKGGRTTRDAGLSPLKRYKPWQTEDFRGIMEYVLDNGEVYRVERNFSANTVRIYDAAYNDITGSFDASREKGPLFAERHLGMTEVCFEKTVYIRQMDARLDSEGSAELLGRLVNASQTGFEDISFKKAQEALREAIKLHSGTEKTTTRPLDRVRVQLEDCRTAKNALLEKRIKGADLERQLAAVRENISKNWKLKALLETFMELSTGCKNIRLLKTGRRELEELLTEQENLAGYSTFSEEDIDNLKADYQKLRLLEETQEKTKSQLDACKRDIAGLEQELRDYRGFKQLGTVEAGKLPELGAELEKLKNGQQAHGIDLLNEQLINAQYRERMPVYLTGALSLAFVAFLWLGWSVNQLLWVALPFDLVLVGVLLHMKHRRSAETAELASKKRKAAAQLQDITRELEKRKKTLNDALALAGAGTLEEYFSRKAAYDNLMHKLTDQNMYMEKLQNEQSVNSRNINLLRDGLQRVFVMAGIEQEADWDENSVRTFTSSVRRCIGLQDEIARVTQKIHELYARMEAIGEAAADRNQSPAHFVLLDISKRIASMESTVQGSTASIREEYDGWEELTARQDILRNILEGNDGEAGLHTELSCVMQEIASAALKEKELETLLQGSEDENDELQRLEEEITVLEQQVSQLTDLQFSLTTALEVLTEASGEIQKEASPGLNSRINDYMGKMTEGRYSDFRVDAKLMLKTPAPETQDIVPAAVLSGGTVDQVYLALRLSMAELLEARGERLPLILDEVFAQYDDQRTRDTFRLLEQLAGDRQIFILSCKNREVALAKEICGEEIHLIELAPV